MKLVKANKRKRFYHTTECMVVKEYGREYFIDLDETDSLRVNETQLKECGHCSGVEKTSGDRSLYLKAKAIGEAE